MTQTATMNQQPAVPFIRHIAQKIRAEAPPGIDPQKTTLAIFVHPSMYTRVMQSATLDLYGIQMVIDTPTFVWENLVFYSVPEMEEGRFHCLPESQVISVTSDP